MGRDGRELKKLTEPRDLRAVVAPCLWQVGQATEELEGEPRQAFRQIAGERLNIVKLGSGTCGVDRL